jgi:hypothetical protein
MGHAPAAEHHPQAVLLALDTEHPSHPRRSTQRSAHERAVVAVSGFQQTLRMAMHPIDPRCPNLLSGGGRWKPRIHTEHRCRVRITATDSFKTLT